LVVAITGVTGYIHWKQCQRISTVGVTVMKNTWWQGWNGTSIWLNGIKLVIRSILWHTPGARQRPPSK
jgi:hypothetical protein